MIWPRLRLLRHERSRIFVANGRLRQVTDLFGAIRSGDRVVIKPNWVRDIHPEGLDLYGLITHPALIRAVVDEVYDALGGVGEIIIADAPIGDADFENLRRVTRID